MVDLSVKMGDLVFKNPIITASATPTHDPERCAKAAKAGSSAVILKTLFHKTAKTTYLFARPRFKLLDWNPILPEPRPGLLRPGEQLIVKEPKRFTLYSIEQSTVWDYTKYRWYIDETKKRVGEDCIVIASIMGGDPEGWIEQCEIVNGSKADAVELNFSCPHAAEVEKGLGVDVGAIPEAAEEIFKICRKNLSIPTVGVKLTAQAADLVAVAKVIERAGVDYITSINRLMGLMIDIDEARPIEWGSYSGFGGPFMLPLTLRWIAKMREAGIKVPISATNGVWDWDDVIRCIMVGADTVQTCTAVMCKGYEEMTKWLKAITEWMEQKGYESISEIKGIALDKIIPVDKIEREVPIMVGGKSSKIAVVDEEKCKKHLRVYSCGWCERACLHDAIEVKEQYAVVDEETCEACGMCRELCPAEAVEIKLKEEVALA
jgi:dihydropyrimidine dehydrogenase (NAD+) subunit PreA